MSDVDKSFEEEMIVYFMDKSSRGHKDSFVEGARWAKQWVENRYFYTLPDNYKGPEKLTEEKKQKIINKFRKDDLVSYDEVITTINDFIAGCTKLGKTGRDATIAAEVIITALDAKFKKQILERLSK